MPKAPAPDLPDTCTSSQLAKLLGLSERVIAGRRLDGRLPVHDGAIDLRALCRAGLNAGTKRLSLEKLNREAFSFAHHVAGKAAAAAVAPRPGETPGQAAARAMDRAMMDDDTFIWPESWSETDEINFADYADLPEDEAAA
ncbi:hypothetical protein [Roseococcus suduntuyensis]|uniref:Uncharacterized protein n=1 Tax=Roseococcus suduntuyensis TaxID=455361 RepID=A0A840AII8_9PROT|nr:hypothetical protein [Roseococcus suduntuyensis]MBB3899964.1 hypothetical protein [Roseococcus suduntuyensis]